MSFKIPILKDLAIVFGENQTEFVNYEEFIMFLRTNRREDEPNIRGYNIFKWLKEKDCIARELNGKHVFRVESILHWFMAHTKVFHVCQVVTKFIKRSLIVCSSQPAVDGCPSIKEIYEKVCRADFLEKHFLSDVTVKEDEISSLNASYKDEFSVEQWMKICLFEFHFMRESNVNMETDTYETLVIKKVNFLEDMQTAHKVSLVMFKQSKSEILQRMQRQQLADLEANICIYGLRAHSPSIIETQIMNAIPDTSFLNSIVFVDCTSLCVHDKSLHVFVDIKEGNESHIPDLKSFVSSFIKRHHKEICAEFVFVSETLQMYTDANGDCLRFKIRDEYLSGKLNTSVLYRWQSYENSNDVCLEDLDEQCLHCYGSAETKPLSSTSFNAISEWYLETPLVCQVIFGKFINKDSLKKAEAKEQFLKKKYNKLYMQYDVCLNVLNKRYTGILQARNTQELSMNYHSLSSVFNITSAGGLTQSLTMAEQKLKEMADNEKTYFNTYLKRYPMTYETNAGRKTQGVCIRDCVLIFMMDNLVRLKKHADPDPGECRTMQICTLPITIKGVPKDSSVCDKWHTADCEAHVDVACVCKQINVLKSTDVDGCLMHLTTEQASVIDDFKKLMTFGYTDIWKAVIEGKLHQISNTGIRQEIEDLDVSLASLQLCDAEEEDALQEISQIDKTAEIEFDEIGGLESIQLDHSLNVSQFENESNLSTMDDSFILNVHSDDEVIREDMGQYHLGENTDVSGSSANPTIQMECSKDKVLTQLGFHQYKPPPLLSRHPPPAVGRDDDIQKLKEILDDVLIKTDSTKETSHKILFAPDHKIAVNLLKLQDSCKKYDIFLPEFPALHLRKSKITILCSAYKDAGILHILKYMRDEEFEEWKKLISADHIEMGTRYIRRLSAALHLGFFIVYLRTHFSADEMENILRDVLETRNIDTHWMSFTSFLQEGKEKNGTFSLHYDIMTHCDEICAIAFAERLGGPRGYNLLLAAVKSSLPFSFLNGASSYASFSTKLLHEYYKSGRYYQNMKQCLFSTPNKGSNINFALDTQREMDHKDALKAFRSGSTVASVLPRMSLLDILNDVDDGKPQLTKERTQSYLLGFETSNTDEKYIVRVLSLILRQEGISLEADEKVYNVYDQSKMILSPAVLDSATKDVGHYLIMKYVVQEGLFNTQRTDTPNIENVTGPKQLLQKIKSSKGVTIKRMSAKIEMETKSDRDRREEARKKSVKMQIRRIDCLSSDMNACQAIVKPDCTKPKVLKSSGMKNALVKTVRDAISKSTEESNDMLERHNLIFLSKRNIPKLVTNTASYATFEFAGVKFKTCASSGQQYLKYIENGIIKKSQVQFPKMKDLVICEEKYKFTPDDFKAATRSQRVSKKVYSVTHLKTSEEVLSSETFQKNSIVTTPEGKSLISTYLARNINKIQVQSAINIFIDSELHIGKCSCLEHPNCCECPRYTHPICAKMYADKAPEIDIITTIKQCKGEAEMSQVDWLVNSQDGLLDGDSCVSIVTSGDIDAVIIHMFALSHQWQRRPDGKFKNSVFVVLQKPGSLYDIYHVTAMLNVLEEKWDDKYIGQKFALVLSMGGNDFLPKLHGISHMKTVDVFLQYPQLRESLFVYEQSSDGILAIKLNLELYKEFIKYLYCSKTVSPHNFTFEEIRQISILPITAKSMDDYRNPQLWMPPLSAIQKMSKNVQCLIDYYLTAGNHSKQMPNFVMCGSLIKSDKGDIEFDLGPDSHIHNIRECIVADPKQLALRQRKKGKRKQDETPQKGQRRKLRPQAASTPRKKTD